MVTRGCALCAPRQVFIFRPSVFAGKLQRDESALFEGIFADDSEHDKNWLLWLTMGDGVWEDDGGLKIKDSIGKGGARE